MLSIFLCWEVVALIFRSRYSMGRVRSTSVKSIGARHQFKKERNRRVYSVMRRLFFWGAILGAVLGVFVLGFVVHLSSKLPDVDGISTFIPSETTKIYSADEVLLADLHEEENRMAVDFDHISSVLVQTVIAVEDTNFYRHHGVDIKGIMRALYVDIMAGAFVQGGSTLTQQLARNLFLTRQRKLTRKVSEMILAIQIERRFTKTDILELYLNQVYWGHNCYGIESASRYYFGKTSQDITLAESALLVGLLKGPELYSPYRSMKRAKARQKIVLERMATLGLITHAQKKKAFESELLLADHSKFRYKAPYFTSHVIKQLIEMYGEEALYTSGMKVFTSLDYRLQKQAEVVVDKYVEYGSTPKWVRGQKVPSLNYSQAALLALDPRNGYVKAMQGGAEFLSHQFNRTTQAKRQPGSSFKPFVYLAALQNNFSPGSFIEDAPVTYNTVDGPYSPRNYTQKYLGNLPMRKALERSVNVVAIKLNYLLGPKKVVSVAKQIGIKSPLKPILSLPLGANEVTMMELVSAYGVFANNGVRVEPVTILKIEDRYGTPLFEHRGKEERVFNSNLVATLVQMMKGVINYGTGKNARLPRPLAGKTGTTSDYRDAWFIGFVPQLVTGTWVGNDDNSPTYKVTGGWVPAMMWREFMKEALVSVPQQDFRRPRGLVQRKVNWLTGKLATEFSPKDSVTAEQYWKGFEPTEYDVANSFWGKRKAAVSDESFSDFFD
ncbi:MAG: penicillin-binding protein [Actinobacteria bacterium]|nr:penicillin-binding protein [Actinomycetota bacterium]